MDLSDVMVNSPITRGNTSRYVGRLIKHPELSFRDTSILSNTGTNNQTDLV
jgi:hypothetical protein